MTDVKSNETGLNMGHVPDPDLVHDDPLLAALLVVAKIHGRPVLPKALVAGLPLKNEKITPDLFARAADRAGFSSRVIKRDLSNIHEMLLPCILILDTGESWVLTRIKGGAYYCIQPEAGEGEVALSFEQLERVFSGYVIFMNRQAVHSGVKRPSLPLAGVHWFWDTLSLSIPIYRDVLLASFVVNLLALGSPLFVMNVYDRVVPNQAFETLWVLALGMFIVIGFDFAIKIMRAWFIDLAGKKSDVLLSAQLYEKVVRLRLSHRPKSVGSFVNNLREFESVRNFITSGSMTVLVDIPFSILFLLVIGWVGGWLVAVLIVAIVVVIAWSYFVKDPMFEAMEKTFTASAEKSGVLVESLNNLETIKVLGAEGTMQTKWEDLVGYIATWGVKSRAWSAAASSASSTIAQLTTVAIIVAGSYMIAEHDLSMGALIATVMLSSRVLMPVSQLAGLLIQWQQSKLALESLNQVMALPTDQDNYRASIGRESVDGGLELRNVKFLYPDQSVAALSDVSFVIKPGEKVGIVGPMGSGKSTIERLLLGLHSPSEGQVLLDGIDMEQLDAHQVRRSIGYVPQDVELFSGSIKENILMAAPHAGDDVLMRAAEMSGVLGFVKRSPSGFEMNVGENGRSLSGGQRQCVAIARALLLDPAILLMDEPTNSMDSASEQQFKNQMSSIAQGKTLLLVTHKASLLDVVDRVIVLNEGKVLADGPRDKVLVALRSGRIRGGSL